LGLALWSQALFSFCKASPNPVEFRNSLSNPDYAEEATMNKLWIALLMTASTLFATDQNAAFYQLETQTIAGETVSLSDYKGKVLLIVNTASQCGYTRQYGPLQELYAAYQDKGLVVMGFPSNDFGSQEPGSNEEIAQFCQANFDIKFPMFAKSPVKGANKNPIFKFLTEQAPKTGEVRWNFEKFLVNREGKVVARFPSRVNPQDKELKAAIEAAL
jgi:glutathione peroxidase